jgi:hemerythrin-like metal-binding protein
MIIVPQRRRRGRAAGLVKHRRKREGGVMLIVWKDGFAIDYGVIDDDHRFLIEHLNAIITALSSQAPIEGVCRDIRQLRVFAELHFQREERLQAVAGYPGLDQHRAEHVELLAQLDGILGQLTKPGDDAQAAYPAAKSFMYRWLLGHIIESDTKIGAFLKTVDSSAELPLVKIAA